MTDIPTAHRRATAVLDEELHVLGRAPDLVVDSTRLRSALGFAEVTTPGQRVRDLVAWYRDSRARRA